VARDQPQGSSILSPLRLPFRHEPEAGDSTRWVGGRERCRVVRGWDVPRREMGCRGFDRRRGDSHAGTSWACEKGQKLCAIPARECVEEWHAGWRGRELRRGVQA
jgi:hypothetical protein